MPDFLAIDWDAQTLCGVAAQVAKGTVRVEKCVRLAWPEGASPDDDPRAAGRWLHDALKQEGVAAKKVLVCLPRENAVVRRLELPGVPAEELPALVRLQAATKTAAGLEQLELDYLPLPRRPDSPAQEVLLVTAAKTVTNRVKAVLDAAELEPVAVGLSSAATAVVVAAADRMGTSLVVVREGPRLELSLVQSGQLIFTHATALDVEDESREIATVLAEVNRVLISQQRLLADSRIARAWVVGTETEHAGLRAALAGRLACEARSLDPLSGGLGLRSDGPPESRALFAGPAGMLLDQAGTNVETVDFLDPRRPAVKRERKKLQIGLAAAGTVLVLAASYGTFKMHEADLAEEIATRETRIDAQEKLLAQGRPTLEAARQIDGWTAGDVHWLEQLQDVQETLPGTDRLYLTEYHVGPAPSEGLARIKAIGYARERFDVEEMNDRLVKKGYRLQPTALTTDRRDPQYPNKFELDMVLVDRPGEPATQR